LGSIPEIVQVNIQLMAGNIGKQVLKHMPWVVAGILLCWPAFYNGFPLVYSDSGTYINSSFDLAPPPDRSIGYGYFIRIVTWQASLWPVVIVQGLILSGLIWRTMRLLLGEGRVWVFVATMTLLTAFSSLPWYVSQLMPDIFAAVLILAFALLLQAGKGMGDRPVGMALIFMATVVHNSHIVIALGVVFFAGIWLLFRMPFRQAAKRMLEMGMPILVATLFLMSNQAANGHGFRLSRTSNLFLAAHLAESELLKPFLEEECPRQHFALCEWGDKIPRNVDEMLWHSETSPITRFGSWESADSAVAPMIKAYFGDGTNLSWFLGRGMKDGFQQMQRFMLGDGLSPYGWDSAPCMAIRWRMPKLVENYLQSRQTTGRLDFTFLQSIQKPMLYLSLVSILVAAVVGWSKLRSRLPWGALILLGSVVNAMVFALLACPVDRYQARISWLLPFVALCFLFALFSKVKPSAQT
jgi:hypothetical protein